MLSQTGIPGWGRSVGENEARSMAGPEATGRHLTSQSQKSKWPANRCASSGCCMNK